MADGKRKEGPAGPRGGSAPKRSKGGVAGRWRTPHQQAMLGERMAMGRSLEVGDQGIWVTYARGMKSKAIRELNELCEEYGQSMYGIPRQSDAAQSDGVDEDGETADIEASIEKELSGMKPTKPTVRKVFTIIPADVECLLFIKTTEPVEPREFVRQICQDARDCTDIMRRKTKYVNRLTPVSNIDKASENGIVKVTKAVLEPYFKLVEGDAEAESAGAAGQTRESRDEEKTNLTYAIRPTTRSHSAFKSDAIIKKVAGLVHPEHKVNLTKPDKVIIVEVYQMFCGVSVVDGIEWESLKRYNVNELYRLASDGDRSDSKAESKAKPEKDETKVVPAAP